MAVSCYLNPNKILIGQDKDFSKNARVFIDRDQPLIPAVSIKEEDIKLQEAKLKEIRKKNRNLSMNNPRYIKIFDSCFFMKNS